MLLNGSLVKVTLLRKYFKVTDFLVRVYCQQTVIISFFSIDHQHSSFCQETV